MGLLNRCFGCLSFEGVIIGVTQNATQSFFFVTQTEHRYQAL